ADDVMSKAQRLGISSFWIKDGIQPGHDAWFYVRSVNLVGKSTFAEASGQCSDDAEGYLEFFNEKIQQTQLAQELWAQIDNSTLRGDIATIEKTVSDTKNEIEQTVSKTLESQSATISQIQKVQTDTGNNLNALYMLKVQKTKDGVPYVAGIGAGIEDADGTPLSQILLAANRTAIIDPSDGNTVPMLVAQGGQIFLNEVLTKSLSINGRFIVTPDGIMTATGAHVAGKIDADSGTLNNVTVNENCTILGTVDAGNILGDVYFRSLFYLDKVVYNAVHPRGAGGDRDNQWIPFLGIDGENFDRYLDTGLTVTLRYVSSLNTAVRYELSVGADDAGGGVSTVWTSGEQGPGDLRNVGGQSILDGDRVVWKFP
ncbi:DUF1983 domain-containing protein, partial [Salmonella enterica]|nr:DUF1983 domain-containing protein [Salmonella enterica]